MSRPEQAEIDDQVNRAFEIQDSVGSKFPGMSYEEGVANALRWVCDEMDELPIEDD